MEKKQETKKTKSLTQKAKKIRSIIMMSLLCVLMMSAATYAWFTLSNTAKATNLTMTVGDTSGLQIAPDDGTTEEQLKFGSSIEFADVKGKLLPATTTDGESFLKPDYDDDGSVKTTLLEVDANEYLPMDNAETEKEGYYILYTFWLRSLGTDSSVKLVEGNGTSTGTYVVYNKPDNQSSDPAVSGAGAVRMSFVSSKDSTKKVAIFEPNKDLPTPEGLKAGTDWALDNSTGTALTPTVSQASNGTIESNASIIELKADTPTKITLYVWIEGKDPQCVNQISAQSLKGQLVFTNKENETT